MDPSMPRKGTPIAVLLDPEKDVPLGEQDIRVEDFLNDKLQTVADLEDLDSLIASVEAQKEMLQKQLQDAKREIQTAKQASTTQTSAMLEQTKEFERQQKSVQDRLLLVTNSDTPEEATRRLQGPFEKLRKVELARSYVSLLNEVEDLKRNARKHLPAEPKEALKSYTKLKNIAILLEELQEPAEGAAVHLVTYVQKTSTDLWFEMKKIMSDEFESVLQKSKWPEATSEPTREWSDCFEKLLDLQAPEIMTAREPLILLPMSVLVKPFIQKFRYHFFSDKPTNHPHQLGDYFLEWFTGTIDTWDNFLRDNVGPVLAAHFRASDLAGNSLYVDPIAAFITALLPVVKEKVDILVQAISNQPQYLSRFIPQLLKFDESVRQKFNYDAGNPEFGWKGLTWDVLDVWFDRWLQVEKDFAFERYREIMQADDSGQIDYDSSSPVRTKPTYGAIKIVDLLVSGTEQYNKLRRFSHKMRFLINIQAELMDQYWGRLKDSLDVYTTITSTMGRTIHGITKEQQAALEGTGRLEILLKVFGSADYLVVMMKEWSNEEFFIELWEQLQDRAKNTDAGNAVAGEMTFNELKDCTSDSMGSEEEGSVFDKTIVTFQQLRNTAEEHLVRAIKYSFPITFKQYLTKPQWTTIGDAPSPNIATVNITAELDHPLESLKQDLAFLRKALSDAPLRRIIRKSIESLQDLLFHDVVLRQDFTSLGATRFLVDVISLQGVIRHTVRFERLAIINMPKLEEAARLLSLPTEKFAGVPMSLEEAANDILSPMTTQQTADCLKKLGITHLTNGEARSVLARRVEANSE